MANIEKAQEIARLKQWILVSETKNANFLVADIQRKGNAAPSCPP
jgi:hypothetical protein